jgi:dTDP-4-dehydrorhamnose 3,5-epimerase
LSECAEVLYKCDEYYHKASEWGIIFNDPALNIDWQIPSGKELVSEKDLLLPTFASHKAEFAF